jgi:hypothetical protein
VELVVNVEPKKQINFRPIPVRPAFA